jgi:hypothetical protein
MNNAGLSEFSHIIDLRATQQLKAKRQEPIYLRHNG